MGSGGPVIWRTKYYATLVNLFQGLHDSRPALESLILVYCVRSVKKYMAKLLLNAMQFVTVRQQTDKQRTNNGNLSSSPISRTSSIRFLLSWMCLWSVSFWLLFSFVLRSLHPFQSIGTTISYPVNPVKRKKVYWHYTKL